MQSPRFAVIDVETTNGDPMNGSIMEVAIIVHDGDREHDRWGSLIDPREDIPAFVQTLTGISPAILQGAPRFAQVAHIVDAMTRDKLVVGHNVRFDMTILQHEFHRLGRDFVRESLCTELSGRKLVPDAERYNLGSLCKHFSIPFHGRHRAMNDAAATAELISRFIPLCSQSTLQALIRPGRPVRRVA